MTTPSTRTTFRFYRGATFSTEAIIIENPDGTPTNITGWTGLMRIWREDQDPAVDDPLYDSSASDATKIFLTVGTTGGQVVGAIPASATDIAVDIDGETWYTRIEMTNTNVSPATVERTIEGYVIAFP